MFQNSKNETYILRFISDPPRDNVSIASHKDFCPYMNVHHSSGIYNKAFYLLCHRPGWNIRKAYHVFLTANSVYWKENTGFSEGACGAVNAAKDLGFNADDVEAVFRDVDVIPCGKERYNFQNFVAISLTPGEKFKKYFDLSSKVSDKVRLEVLTDEEDCNYCLNVTFNGAEIAQIESDKSEVLKLDNLEPGRYHIAMEGNVSQISVMVLMEIFETEITVEDQIKPENPTMYGNVQFKVENDNSGDFGLLIRSYNEEYDHGLLTRYGELIDIHSRYYDGRGQQFSSNVTQEVLYCSQRTGMYDVGIICKEKVNVTISVYKLYNLHPRVEV